MEISELMDISGFSPCNEPFLDLETFRKENVKVISMKKYKADKKAFRQASNHLDAGLVSELKTAISEAARDEGISSIILASSHKVAFSRGAKIEELAGVDSKAAHSFIRGAQSLVLDIQRCPKPIIAVVSGLTFGGGLEVCLACDYRIAGTRENIVFGFPEGLLGVIPAMGGTQNLPIIVGKPASFEIMANARTDITPFQAKDMGIVDLLADGNDLFKEALKLAQSGKLAKAISVPDTQVDIPDGSLETEIRDYIKRASQKSAHDGAAAPLTKIVLQWIFEKTSPEKYIEGLKYEEEAICFLRNTEDFAEGLKALSEERKPVFKGR